MRSSTSPTLRRELREGIATFTLDRPEQRNAIDSELCEALAAAFDEAARDGAVQAVVLTGGSGAFCAGGDLGGFDELADARVYRHVSHRLTRLIEQVERLEKPVIAVIDGAAVGAGLTLALVCDWRIASARARLIYGEGRLGLVPTHGGVIRLVKLVGLARAKQALLGGDRIDAQAALALGLVTEVRTADHDELIEGAHVRARTMLEARAPLSFAAAKRLLHAAADTDVHAGILAESLAQTALLQSEDHREGLAARREGRPPEFTGR